MKASILLALLCAIASGCSSSSTGVSTNGKAPKDSLTFARAHHDSVKWAHLDSIAVFPYLKGSKWSGIIPVANPTEIPDTNHDYKLLFEVTEKNPDSLAKNINSG